MQKYYKHFLYIKTFFLIISLGIFAYLWFFVDQEPTHYWKNLVFIVDVNNYMEQWWISGHYWIDTPKIEFISNYLQDYVQWIENEYNIWVVIFDEQSVYEIPPTQDYETLTNYLKWLNTNIVSVPRNIDYEYRWLNSWIYEFSKYSADWTAGVLISSSDEQIENELQQKIQQKNQILHILDLSLDWSLQWKNISWVYENIDDIEQIEELEFIWKKSKGSQEPHPLIEKIAWFFAILWL